MTAPPPVARLDAVTHEYGATLALDAVSLSIPAGRMVGLIGPGGVGKSTLLALIAGVRRLQSGEVTTLGGSMRAATHRQAVCARIAYMPQGLGGTSILPCRCSKMSTSLPGCSGRVPPSA